MTGEPKAVETFLRAEALRDISKKFDLSRLQVLLATGSNMARASRPAAAAVVALAATRPQAPGHDEA